MEFQFDLIWKPSLEGKEASLADSLEAEPVVVLNSAAIENPVIVKDLFTP